VIVTGDEGETFLPSGPRRNVTRRNLGDVAFIPLFVKLPGQKRGRIDDGYARNMDVLPTIAHVLGIRLPWQVDGRSLLGRTPPGHTTESPRARRPHTAGQRDGQPARLGQSRCLRPARRAAK